MNIRISKAKPEDAEEMMAIRLVASFSAYVNEEYNITEEDMLVQCGPESIDRLKDGLASGKTRGWLLIDKDKNEIIGASTAKEKKDKIIFSTMHLLPEYHGLGLGRMLINEMFAWVEKRPKKPLVCFVISFNTQRREWYKRLGFEEVEERNWNLKTGKVVPKIKMIKRV